MTTFGGSGSGGGTTGAIATGLVSTTAGVVLEVVGKVEGPTAEPVDGVVTTVETADGGGALSFGAALVFAATLVSGTAFGSAGCVIHRTAKNPPMTNTAKNVAPAP